MEVDGDSSHPIEPTSSIVFDSVGEHTIRFTLSDPITLAPNTFFYCNHLTSVVIPNSVTSIGYDAFNNCSSLTSVTIPNSVTSIGNGAFHHCEGLTSVTIPNSVISIGNDAFSYCSGLTSVTVLATTPPTLGNTNTFNNNASGRKIYVPAASLDTYKAASGWSDYVADIEAIQ